MNILLRYNVFNDKNIPSRDSYDPSTFTLNTNEVQNIIKHSVKDNVSKNILTTIYNQLIEEQRSEYIQAKEYERTEMRTSKQNNYYERDYMTQRVLLN